MLISLGRAEVPLHPQIRRMNALRDGRALADMLETAYLDEPWDPDQGEVIAFLRTFGSFDTSLLSEAAGYLWCEGGAIVGNASVMRNQARRDTWVIGNVATHADHRRRGIGRALVASCLRYAHRRGGRFAALQVTAANAPALAMYRAFGFSTLGVVEQYVLGAGRRVGAPTRPIARASWRKRHALAAVLERAMPEAFTWATFSQHDSPLGLRYWLDAWLVGLYSAWWFDPVAGALCARLGGAHGPNLFDLYPAAQAGASDLEALCVTALEFVRAEHRGLAVFSLARLDKDPAGEAAREALKALGLSPLRTLVHMRLALEDAGWQEALDA